jgi:hypothetical protein
MGDVPPTREELLKAREDLQRDLERIANPANYRDRNPQLVEKLQTMLDEINDCLADRGADDAQRKQRGSVP